MGDNTAGCVLFADVSGSTKLYETIGDAAAHEAIDLCVHSANGTYLSIDADREVVLRREETLLRGHGFITLGQSRATATEFVEYFCE